MPPEFQHGAKERTGVSPLVIEPQEQVLRPAALAQLATAVMHSICSRPRKAGGLKAAPPGPGGSFSAEIRPACAQDAT